MALCWMIQLQAKECQRLPENPAEAIGRDKEEFPCRFQRQHGPADNFILDI